MTQTRKDWKINGVSVSWGTTSSDLYYIKFDFLKNLREKEQKKFEKKFPDLMKIVNLQIQEAQTTPSKRKMRKTTSRHIKIKLFKISDKHNVKGSKTKRHYIQKVKYKNDRRFSMKTMQARRQQGNVYKMLKEKKKTCQSEFYIQ